MGEIGGEGGRETNREKKRVIDREKDGSFNVCESGVCTLVSSLVLRRVCSHIILLVQSVAGYWSSYV